MSELFSKIRLIDYFFMIEIDNIQYDNNNNFENIEFLFNTEEYSSMRINYKYRTLIKLPKKNYSHIYDVQLDSIFETLPTEYIYFSKPPNNYFPLILTNSDSKYYYGFFYKTYELLDDSHPIYSRLKDFSLSLKVYVPKYLCFLSMNPFFISFKFMLEEIYIQSCINNNKCYKVENIIGNLLYRTYLPKYETTQVQFAFGERMYSFTNKNISSEVSLNLLFSYLNVERIVLLILGFLMNSIIVIFHSDLGILAPIIYSFMTLLYPLPVNYSICNNLNPKLIDIIDSPTDMLLIGIYKKDFPDLAQVYEKIKNSSNIIYCDLDSNLIDLKYNEDLVVKRDILPINRIKNLIEKLMKDANLYDAELLKSKLKNVNIWEYYQSNDLTFKGINYSGKKNKFPELKIEEKRKTKIISTNALENFSEPYIRSLFLEFILGLFEAYDENKHYTIDSDHDVNFNADKFIDDSKSDIRNLLNLIINERPSLDIFLQNINHMVDIKYKKKVLLQENINMNKHIKHMNINDNTEEIYNNFINGLERRKAGKSLEKIFLKNIFNTISMNSPTYEKLTYIQNNIFEDPIHEEIIKHDTALPIFDLNLNYNFIGLNLSNQQNYENFVSKEENLFLRKSTVIPGQYSLVYEFKKHVYDNKDVINSYFNYLPLKNNSILIYNNVQKIIKNDSKNKQDINIIYNSKDEVIKSYNRYMEKIINKNNHKIEFHINYGRNVIQTISFCDYCLRPNNIWDVRKNFTFSKAKKETRTKCKFCNFAYVPYFIVIEEKEKKIFPGDDETDSKYIHKKIEYMSLEHIVCVYDDLMNDEKLEKQKKFPISLYYNIWLLMGEYIIRIEKAKILHFNFNDYLKMMINDNAWGDEYIQNQEVLSLVKLIKETELKRQKDEIDKIKLDKRNQNKTDKNKNKNKAVNIKFELKDLLYRYKDIEKDITELKKNKKKKNKLSEFDDILDFNSSDKIELEDKKNFELFRRISTIKDKRNEELLENSFNDIEINNLKSKMNKVKYQSDKKN